MKYYIYVSESKVDMLFSQLPPEEQKTIAAELGFDLKILQGKISSQRVSGESNHSVIQRCQLIQKCIRNHDGVGRLTDTKPWVADLCIARCFDLESDGTMFIGQSGFHTVGLVGSAKHLIGIEKNNKSFFGRERLLSFGPDILDAITRLAETDDSFGPLEPSVEGGIESMVTSFGTPAWVRVIRHLNEQGAQSPMKLDFFAKRLFFHEGVILLTPLFIALSDE
jgi:hypothetical protein